MICFASGGGGEAEFYYQSQRTSKKETLHFSNDAIKMKFVVYALVLIHFEIFIHLGGLILNKEYYNFVIYININYI